jgi:hypothetical protein
MEPFNRRQALSTISTSLAFAAMSTRNALAQNMNPMAAKPTHFPAKAKHVIVLFMSGAQSHVDTFDYKPSLLKGGSTGRGKLKPPIAEFAQRGQSGLWISDLYPNLARQADDLCLLRGMYSGVPNHPSATRAAHTGSAVFIRPSLGAWTVYGLGTENTDLPGFVALGDATGVNFGSAFLPAHYQATPVNPGVSTGGQRGGGGRGPARDEAIANIKPTLANRAQRTQLNFLKKLNQEALRQDVHQPAVEGIMQSYELAFRMQDSMPKVMDTSRETATTKAMYGIGDSATNAFGTQCLLARRMVESGVRFIELTAKGWDHHTDIDEKLPESCSKVDKPIAGLLADLKQRDLLKDTLVVFASEFGRTPTGSGSGRGHNNKGYTTWMAGGGVKGGFSHGATDEIGQEAVEGKMHTPDWHATILHLLGLDHTKLTYPHAGRNFRLTDVHGNVAKEILA